MWSKHPAPSVKDTLDSDVSGDITFRFYGLGAVIFCVAVFYMMLSIVRKYRRSAFGTAVISRKEIKDKVQKNLKPSETEQKKHWYRVLLKLYYKSVTEILRYYAAEYP